MMHWKTRWAIGSSIAAVALLCFINIAYTNYAIHDGIDSNNKITCPLYSILDRPVAPTDNADTKKVRQAIHDARVKYNCPPPLIKSTTTTRSTSGSR